MNPIMLRRISIIGAVLTVLVAADGLFMVLANYKPDDTANNGFASFHPSDGGTVLIAAGLLLIVSALAFYLSMRSSAGASKQEAKGEPEVQA